MTDYRGPFASQARPGDWNDCVATSGINMVNPAGARAPTTHAEIDALRVASGDTVGAQNLRTLSDGIARRYDLYPTPSSTRAAIADGIAKGRWFVIHGNYWTLPDSLEIQKPPHDRFSHAVTIGPGDKAGTVWWVDPLERAIVHGRSVALNVALDFAGTNGYDALSLPEKARSRRHGHLAIDGAFWRYDVALGMLITGRRQYTGRKFSADTTLEMSRRWPGHGSCQVVRVTSGAYKGWWIGTASQDYTEV